ncbi:C-terminal processing protease CtpA/Prc, contains a PDZ domain [Nonlabens sp. Hel1_33_55]|uniref:S41 family peptidase n=1 Tax=Nonlabens sp. Hel1_33_55 TaxID=1336802 RepID=UPI000875CF7D|nr:S41 family peptidase [Nonlabens sp. Hel1_33_55]SCX98561.1 C-terminal processing protease CtpA/Prc, contains a PDZ domain [Nonlabens sp. Hel1_33_55]
MKNLLFLFSFCVSIIAAAQNDAGWLRHSSISPDGSQIAFTYKGDLYKVSSNGGNAQQLTFHQAHDYMAVWSKDGKSIAFASNRYGNFDVYVMSANGGGATRMTYHSSDEEPYTFSADGSQIYFGGLRQDTAQHRQFPTGSQPEVYTVPVAGGRVNQLFTIPAEALAVNSDGTTILYHDKKGGENDWRKHHTSSIARDLWSYDLAADKHTMLTNYNGEDRQPVYGDDDQTVYYLSEQSGSFNVYKMDLNNPTKSTQLTDFKTHPVRFLSYGNGTLSFGYDGKLYTMKEGEQPQKLAVNITTQEIGNSDKFISVNGGVQEMAVSPNGKEIAFIARGEVFVTSVEESFTKRLTNTPEAEEFVTWGPDGKSVVYSSERNGKWSIYKTEIQRKEEPFFFASTLLKETPVIENEKDNYLARYSPDGKKIAFIEDRKTLKVKDVKSGDEVTLLTPEELFHMSDGDKYFRWSPDSKWLLVDWSLSLSNSDVLLMAANGSKRVNLNDSGYYDSNPVWVNDGKQMLWFSNRDGLKSYATSGSTQSDVYSMFFTQDAWDEFNLSEEEYDLMKEIKKLSEKKSDDDKDDKKKDKKDKDKKEDEPVKDLTFDWDEIKDRVKKFTIHSSNLNDAVLSKENDKLYYLTRFEDKLDLWETDLRTQETKMKMKLGASSGNLEWDADRDNLFLLSSGKISKIDPEKEKKEGVDISGEMEYDAVAERQAMFDHVWLRTNKIFYHSNFHGIDWDQMKTEYEKHLPYIGNSTEFAELLSEMLGELNVSHAGAKGASYSIDNEDETASLGIFMDYNYKDNGIKIEEILTAGPLDKAKFDIKPGMVIEKIDGQEIQSSADVARYLNRKKDKFTLLEISDPDKKENMVVTVKPISLGEERGLLYKRWVKTNEKEVAEKSNGKLGYVHIPGMSDGPYRDVYDKMMGKYHGRDGVIVDTRFNGGGDLVADLAAFFTGQPFITYATEQKVVGGEPTSRWTKPTLAMINEAQYSDGHCFAAGYSDLKIGTTVGMPTPGTCSFAGWERLPDGSRWGVVPVSAKDINGDWMENNQTNPMIQVKNTPASISKGIDEQLDRAIKELMKEVE